MAALPFTFFMRYYLGFPRLLRKGRPTAPIIEVGAGPVHEEELVVPHANSVRGGDLLTQPHGSSHTGTDWEARDLLPIHFCG